MNNKLIEKFDMVNANAKNTPNFDENVLHNENSKPSTFKFREAVGALQWLAVTARPDIAHSTNTLARASAKSVTKSCLLYTSDAADE